MSEEKDKQLEEGAADTQEGDDDVEAQSSKPVAEEQEEGSGFEKDDTQTEEDDVPVSFDWSVYVDATLAGLSVLIPLPFVDNIFERFFRRRMIRSIAARRKVELSPERISLVNDRRSVCGMIGAFFFFPIFFCMEIFISLFRILVYCYTVKKSTDALNYYWQRAFLMDYVLQRGYLSDTKEQADTAIAAMERLLDDVGASPLSRLARKVIYGPCRIFCSLMRYVFRTGRKDSSIDQTEQTMSESWGGFGGYFRSLAKRYESELAASQRPTTTRCCCVC